MRAIGRGGRGRWPCWADCFCCLALIYCLSLQAVASAPPLRYVSDEAYPPLSYFYGDKPKGLGVDLARAVAERLGRPLEIALLPWPAAQAQVRQGGSDFLGPMAINPQRRELFDFTVPFYRFEFVFLVRKDSRGLHVLNDFAGKRVGVTAGGYPQQRLDAESAMRLVVVDDTEAAIRLLREGQIDAYAVDKWVGTYELGLLGAHDVAVAGPPFEILESALAVQKGNAGLLIELDAALAALIQAGDYQKILDRWQANNIVVLSEKEQQERDRLLKGIALLVFLTLFASGAWIMFLRKQVVARRASEQALQDSEQRFRLALTATRDVIWDWDIVRDAQSWSAAGTEVFGWKDIIDKEQTAAWWYERVHDDDRERVVAGFQAVLDDPVRDYWEDEYRFRRVDGDYAQVEDRGHVVRDARGMAVRMIGAMRDVTTSKTIMLDLKTAGQLMQSAIDSLPSHIAILDETGRILLVNQRWRDFAAAGNWSDPASGVGSNYLTACQDTGGAVAGASRTSDDAGLVRQKLQDLLSGRADYFEHEYACPDPEGNQRWFIMSAHRFRHGDLTRILVRHTNITERRNLEATQRHLMRAVEASGNSVMITDRDARIIYVNPAYTKLTGYSSAESLGRNPSFLHAADSIVTDYAAMWNALLGGRTWVGEFRNQRKDGSVLWEMATISPILDEQGNPEHFVAVKEDITEKRHLHDQLENYKHHLELLVADRTAQLAIANRRAESVLASTGDGIIGTDLTGAVTLVNPAAETMLGYSENELLGRNVHDAIHFLHADRRPYPREECIAIRAIREGEILHADADTFWRADGSPLSVALATHPIVEDGRLIGGVLSFSDITQRQQAEEALRESEARFRAMADAAPVLIWISGLDKLCYFFNQGWLRFTGRSMEQEMGNGWAAGVHPDDLDRCIEIYTRSFDDRVPFAMEYRLMHHSGKHRWILDSGVPRYDGKGTFLGYIGACIDIEEIKLAEAEREKAREAAEQLARIKSEFLANMSHEIRTPLNGVLGLAQIGYRDSANRSKTQDTFAKILDSGKLLLGVINDILDFSKIEAGRLLIESVPCEPRQVVSDTVAMVAERANAKGITINCRFDANLPKSCMGDPTRLSQILLNLLSNAVKFTDAGEITVTASLEGARLKFVVADSGIGMSADQVSRLFMPFEQADASTTRKFGGTGLGLSITKRLCDLMAGSIDVSSQPGLGSCFEVWLPYVQADSVPGRAAAIGLAADRQRLPGARILVADDNEINRIVIEDMLEGEGAIVMLAHDGLQALTAIERMPHGYDLVLMDVQMPLMDGREATRLIHALVPTLPVIGQTAHALAEEHAQCIAAGMADTITKPLDHERLVAMVMRYLPDTGMGRGNCEPEVRRRQATLEQPVFDYEAMLRTNGGRREFVVKLLRLALDSFAETSAELRRAAAAGDPQVLEEISHKIKGTAGHYHAGPLVECAARLELAARERRADAASKAESLVRSLDGFLEVIRSRLDD